MSKSVQIKIKFKELGFDLIGFSKPYLDNKLTENFKKRASRDDLPPFMHSDLNSVLHPKRLHPWLETVIVVGLSYASSQNNDTRGFISSYTRGRDYHKVMAEMIQEGLKYLKKIYKDIKYSYYIDNGPVLEKVLAQQAGLGWIGKNTLLINENFGSYIFLGEIFINKKLVYNEKSKNNCEDCTQCMDNCPTNSLHTPYYLDYRTCRSNLTQIKGILKKEEEMMMGNCIWGCDECQINCPYNNNIPRDLHPAFEAKIGGNIVEILNYNRKGFPPSWTSSALSWRGMRIIQRNALIVLGNLGLKDEKYKKLIVKKMDDRSKIIRHYAYQTYLKLGFNLEHIKGKIDQEKEIDIDNIIKRK